MTTQSQKKWDSKVICLSPTKASMGNSGQNRPDLSGRKMLGYLKAGGEIKMKLKIDTTEKTIQVEDIVELDELMKDYGGHGYKIIPSYPPYTIFPVYPTYPSWPTMPEPPYYWSPTICGTGEVK